MKAVMTMLGVLMVAALMGSPAYGVLHPVLNDLQILWCQENTIPGAGGNYACGLRSERTSGLRLQEVQPLNPPNPSGGRELVAAAVQCRYGSGPQRKPFSDCYWSYESFNVAGPLLERNSCMLVSTNSWQLTANSDCRLTRFIWSHFGADVGGECVFFVQREGANAYGAIYTVSGIMTAEQAANNASAFCQRPIPPDVTCNISLPSTIDHGDVSQTERSVKQIYGSVDCGANPVLTVQGGNKLTLAQGVTTQINVSQSVPGRVVLTSTLNAVNAAPGSYRGSLVVIASPY